jgi:hypothetical protein
MIVFELFGLIKQRGPKTEVPFAGSAAECSRFVQANHLIPENAREGGLKY